MRTPFNLSELRREPDLAVRDQVLRAERVKLRKLHPHEPLTGAWYWVPQPNKKGGVEWGILEFFDLWQPSSDHIAIWSHVLDHLQLQWGRSLRGIEYCSLPRGRVSQMLLNALDESQPAIFAMYHGNDAPLGKRSLSKVRHAFKLPPQARVIFDEHERCIAGQPEVLSRALGYDLGIQGVTASELDWDDDE